MVRVHSPPYKIKLTRQADRTDSGAVWFGFNLGVRKQEYFILELLTGYFASLDSNTTKNPDEAEDPRHVGLERGA
jgi:hypothetical protein